MADAVKLAVQWLTDNPNCQALFGTAQTRSGAFNPITVLNVLFGGSGDTPYGKVGFAYLPHPSAAITIPLPTFISAGMISVPVGYTPAVIINEVNIAGSNSWNNGDAFNNALTILHELGHVYSLLPGSGGSQIKWDSLGGSDANAELVT